jgi:hypothetical protein
MNINVIQLRDSMQNIASRNMDEKKGWMIQPFCIFAMSYELKAIFMLSSSYTMETCSLRKQRCP